MSGFTLFELLVVVAALGVIMLTVLKVINPAVQIAKSRDARRKTDLQKMKFVLEDYYNDYRCYPPNSALSCNPGTGLQPYLMKVPCDPNEGSLGYLYQKIDCKTYRIYAKLESKVDSDITVAGCSGATGCPNNSAYNYGVSSPNTGL